MFFCGARFSALVLVQTSVEFASYSGAGLSACILNWPREGWRTWSEEEEEEKLKYCPPTKRRRGEYQGPLACTVYSKSVGIIFGRFLPLPLHSQSKELN
jgi:hypothetical protein